METCREPVYVTKTFLPPLEESVRYLDGIWERNCLTISGLLVCELEAGLKEYLRVEHHIFVRKGAIVLVIAIQAPELRANIITTPFTHVASTSTIVWEGCRPVYAEVAPDDRCLDPAQIDRAVDDETTGIMPVHVYGMPCDVERTREVACRRGLKVLYGAAHAFGTKYRRDSLLAHGYAGTLSYAGVSSTPIAASASACVLCLPQSAHVSAWDIECVAGALVRCFGRE